MPTEVEFRKIQHRATVEPVSHKNDLIKYGRIGLTIAALFAAIWIAVANSDREAIARTASQINPGILAAAFATSLIAALIASVRLLVTARQFGYRISFREAIAAMSLGQVAGALFFQLAGQLIARSAWLAGSQVPLSGTVMVTGYERLSALVASALLASAGAFFLFGGIHWNVGESGMEPVRLALGVAAVLVFGAWLAWGELARSTLALLTPKIIGLFGINLGLSILIQAATMEGYILLARMLNPSLDLLSLSAATSLVMFAASVPISLAGWGVREMSAVAALGAIGLTAESSVLVAILIGALSMAAAGLLSLTAISLTRTQTSSAETAPRRDYSTFLDVAVPLIAGSALFFQIFVPVNSGVLNVNLADPFVFLGAGIFAVHCVTVVSPRWRLPGLFVYVALATLALTLSYIHGVVEIGWTVWASTNKFFGWFVLLCYGATGALIAWRASNGRELVIKTMAATGAAVIAVEVTAQVLARCHIVAALPYATIPMSGFSQNRNAFSFLLLLCVAGLLSIQWRGRYLLIGVLAGGLALSGSRAAYIAVCVVLIVALWKKAIGLGQLAKTAGVAAAVVGAVLVIPEIVLRIELAFAQGIDSLSLTTQLIPYPNMSEPSSNDQRMQALSDAWTMFLENPIFGAGLGVFFEQTRRAGNAIVIHSVALWLAAETGLVGLLIFCAAPFRVFFDHWRSAAGDKSSLLLILLLTAFAVMSVPHEILYQRGFWLLFGAALVVPVLGDQAEAAQSSRQP